MLATHRVTRVRAFSGPMAAALLLALAANAATLPLVEEVTHGVYSVGAAHSHRSANCGWIVLSSQTILVDLPRGIEPGPYLEEVRKRGAPDRFSLVLTCYQEGDGNLLARFVAAGVEKVFCSPAVYGLLTAGRTSLPAERIVVVAARTAVGADHERVEVIPLDDIVASGGAVVYLAEKKVLFAGPFVSHGPRIGLVGSRTGPWVDALRRLDQLPVEYVVPGEGSWGDAGILRRHLRFLDALRRQIGHLVAQGRPVEALTEVRIPAHALAWPPYDQPRMEDLEHIYSELRVPAAPFYENPPNRDDSRPHALVLIGDGPHAPGRLEDGLRPVFAAAGVTPHFTVDVEALNAENLDRVPLLVVFRDGLQRPGTGPNSDYRWMTPEQEQAVVEFVEGGGGFLNLHNSMGLYPEGGPYLELVGGRYAGHGPLERFHVEVVDPNHPVTRGVTGFTVADEQHTPPYDAARCHLLLRNRTLDGKVVAAAGWTREPGDGRLCYLANGHTREALRHPMFQRVMCNALEWLLRRE